MRFWFDSADDRWTARQDRDGDELRLGRCTSDGQDEDGCQRRGAYSAQADAAAS